MRPVLAKWLPLVKVYDSDSPKTALLNGDVDLGVVWSGEAAILIKEQPEKFEYVLPEEGAHMFIDSLAIPKGAQNVDAAHKFIDYILRPEVSKHDLRRTSRTPTRTSRRASCSRRRSARTRRAIRPATRSSTTFRDIGPLAADVDKLVTDLKAQSGS